ncbi:MAG: molybdopterin-dependent oxidoreductase, partial [Phycisphaeraceae bacterium]|nr:molybdopterin-dependent oxidoreductase [Phycisphaeraceae bacterium]
EACPDRVLAVAAAGLDDLEDDGLGGHVDAGLDDAGVAGVLLEAGELLVGVVELLQRPVELLRLLADRDLVPGEPPEPKKDPTLEHPQCVYRILERHYARYTIGRVSAVTGTPPDDLERVYRTFAETGTADKAGTIMFAMGWTQHTAGTQTIRTMAIVQSLLGNIGRPGGGMNALRGESNVQG